MASQAKNTAVCLLDWRPGRCEVRLLASEGSGPQERDTDRLLALMLGDGVEKVGIDAPLGWPVAFVRAVADLDAWPLEAERPKVELERRHTDRWIHRQTGKVPLSVSTDRIAYPAMRAARLIRRYQDHTERRIDRTGVSGPVCEVYPDTAVTAFGLRPPQLPRLGYKGADGASVRAIMVERLTGRAPWLALDAEHRERCIASDDHFDALIAALITRAVALGQTHPPPAEMAADAAREGWIHLPRGGLDRLAPALA